MNHGRLFLAAVAGLFFSLSAVAADLIRVVDQNNRPVAQATILLGYEVGDPFSDNLLVTDGSGTASIPADWKAALPVTVQAPGYITLTVPVMSPGEHEMQLTRQEGGDSIEVKGTTTGYGRLPSDGKVNFALVIPALTREQMLAFDLASVISPQNDAIEIIGNPVKIPSNIALPEQRETFIFPITLNKPDYRLFVRSPGQYRITALHGQFPLQRVVNDIRGGKSIFEVINHFTLIEQGQIDVDVRGPVSGANMVVNQNRFTQNIAVKAPTFAAGHVMLGLAMLEENGTFVPTDIKRFTPGQSMNLKSRDNGRTPAVLSLLLEEEKKSYQFNIEPDQPWVNKMQDFSRLSFAFTPATGTVTPKFLPLTAKPVVNGNVVKVVPPTLPAGLTAVATGLVYSEVEELGTEDVRNERRTRLWEVWSNGWLSHIELPKINFPRDPKRKYRWEVLFLARPSHFVGESISNGRVDLESITHVSRNALDL